MKHDIILAGVGGQGILTIAAVVARTAVRRGLNLKQSEVHGMAQRGGAVLAHLRISDEPIYSDLVPRGKADFVVAVEPLEALRQAPSLAAHGKLLVNRTPLTNIDNYPELEDIYAEIERIPGHCLIDADALAKKAGSGRAMNMVMLGTLSHWLDDGIPADAFLQTIDEVFRSKGEKIVAVNKEAFESGRRAAEQGGKETDA